LSREPLIGRSLPPGAAFADIKVGLRAVSTEVCEPAASGLALLAGLLGAVRPCADATISQLTWEQLPGEPTGGVHLVGTVTRYGPGGKPGSGRIVQDLRLVDAEGIELQRGRAQWHVPSVSVPEDPALAAFSLGSVEWGKRVGARLSVNAAFRSTTTPFDGAIGFSSGTDEVNFRIYRGEVIEVSRKAVNGPTFTIDAPELTWLDLLASPTNDFVRRTMTGAFKVRGDGFQYVRMIKAVMLILDEARAEAAEALHA
jgi:putative sterol carrier protein